MTIFVSIAAYRDPELIPTIRDCVARARWPGELRFGICWQHADGEPVPRVPAPARSRLIDIPWRDSRGACWARAEIMRLYDGEEYFLQLDSHHRFVQDWDARLIGELERSGADKPLLSTYPPDYDPDTPLPPGDVPTRLQLNHFFPNGNVSFSARAMPHWQERTAPMRARFLGAGMLFTPGSFVADVPYDPELYFDGEEITLAIRAFTHGYDLFHPAVHAIWHQNSSHLRKRHWDDHTPDAAVAITGHDRNSASLNKVADFLRDRPIGPLACGTVRSFAAYEAYAGLDFRRRAATAAARGGHEPLPPAAPPASLKTWRISIALDRETLSGAALNAPRFWYVGVHDEANVEIARADAQHAELARAIRSPAPRIVLEREVRSARPPARWTVWPVDRHGHWLEPHHGAIDAALPA